MKGRKTRWAVLAAMALVGGMASSALAIEAFQERFEWGDLSKPTTLLGRVAVVDPYDKAAWVNMCRVWWKCGKWLLLAKVFPWERI